MWPLPRLAPHLQIRDRANPRKKVGSMTKISSRLKTPGSFKEALSFSLKLPDFFDEAICVGAEPGIFDGESLMDVLEAKKICSACPIQAMCLDWATQTQDAGVWGGQTPEERSKFRGGTKPADIGEIRLLETNRARLLSDPASILAAEFEVAERTIYRWRKNMRQDQRAS
jgi:WhiB family transcriptional regulator, redox-sensing transcriptional regulator